LPEGVDEYDLIVKAKRLGPGHGVGLTFRLPAVDRWAKFYLGGAYGSGLESIDGKDYKNPEVNTKHVLFPAGFDSKIICRIRRDRLEAIVDGHSVVNWVGDQRRLTKRPEEAFKLGCETFEISELTVLLLPQADPPASEKTRTEAGVETDKPRTFDLLALMDGSVAVAGGGRMFAMTQQRDGTPIPFRLPEGVDEYDVTLVATRLGTGQGLSLNVPLPAVGRFVNFYLDGFDGSGLQFIDGEDYKLPEINQKGTLFRNGFKSTVVCKIRRDRIEAIVDGRPLINWTGDQKRLAGRTQKFVLGCHNAHFEITELTVSLLPDAGDKSPPPAAAATNAADGDQPGADKREQSAIDSDHAHQAETDDSRSKALPEDKSVDLLSLIDIRRHVVQGRWTKKKTSLLSVSDEYSLLQIPYRPPPEYTLEIKAARTSRSRSDIQFGIVAGKNRCHIVVDGWAGQISGISYIDGRGAADNATTYRGRVFPDTGTALIVIDVRNEHITVDADGKRIIDWIGSFDSLSMAPDHQLDRRALFLAIQRGASYRIDSMKLIPHAGEGMRIR
jgi:hypothetical protein